ncbi:MFS transporter [Dyadobacter sp. CY345]|uniref:MFS transporter n=1 Tax=Dyadobacter sp. CY345 TaxID=2909335 RepID=UPI001F26CD3A|nr:MFS transporter [Dyadobacter sp. CY345]
MNDTLKLPEKHDAYSALRFPEFRYFLANSFLYRSALLIQEVIIGYELYRLTHDPLALGMIGLAEVVPFITVSLFGGHVADRYDRRIILRISLCVIIAGSAILYFLFQPEWLAALNKNQHLWSVYAAFFLIGLAKGFYSPASSSLKPFLVPREFYSNSSTWSSTFSQAGAVLGPGIAGFLYVYLGLTETLLGIMLTMVFCLVLITLIKTNPVNIRNAGISIWESLRDGLRFVFRTKIILYALSLDMFSVLFGGVIAILPVFAEDILHVGPEGLGLLRAAPSVGALITMFAMAHFPPTHQAWRNMLIAVAGFGVFTIIFSLSTNFWLSCVALFATGVCDSISVVIRQTIMQIFPPDEMRGRVASVSGIFVSSSNELGAFESGLATKIAGPIPTVFAGGAITLLVVTYVYLKSKDLFAMRLT